MTPKEVLALIREREVKAVDLRFNDFPGRWQHVTIPADALDEAVFEDGLGFDGASVRGWKAINESDMLLLPESDTAFIDPFCRDTTLTLICNIQEPLTKEDYARDPRNIARKAVNHMRATGTADAALFGPALEFFVFDDVRFDQTARSARAQRHGGNRYGMHTRDEDRHQPVTSRFVNDIGERVSNHGDRCGGGKTRPAVNLHRNRPAAV